jgi:predicted transglutaminase-like cysteine proteinase
MIQTALQELNSKFVYQADGRVDIWRILHGEGPWKGDCEDYSLTLMWLLSDKSVIKFLWHILTFKYLMWYVIMSNGEGHAIVKIDGMYYDNVQKKATSAEELKQKGYRFIFPMIFPIVYFKLLFSYTIGLLIK